MLRIGLAAYQFKNGDIQYNLARIETALGEAQGKIDLLCFGEAFLHGFDSPVWDYGRDKATAVSLDCETMLKIRHLTERYGVDLLFGYIESAGDALYSSCAVIERGEVKQRLPFGEQRIMAVEL